MIVKIHADGGHSFKCLTEYLVKDEARVDFVDTRNLITQNPYTAARVMAATAMNQAELKKAAGIKNTGRKSKRGAVFHFTLSWEDEEAKNRNLDRWEVERAVDTLLEQLGAKKKIRSQYADEHQILMVRHNDKDHSHVHVVVNNVHPEHGVMLPDNHNFLKTSTWALKYERESGRIYCPERAINWKARNRHQYVRYREDTRKEWEAKKQTSNDNRPALDKTIAENKKKDADIYQKRRDQKQRHQEQWDKLSYDNKARLADIEAKANRNIGQALAKVREEFRPLWKEHFIEQELDLEQFTTDEQNFIGRVKNRVKSIDFKGIFTAGERRKAISQAFDAFASSGVRLEAFKKREKAKERQLETRQKEAEAKVILPHQEARKAAIKENREVFSKQRFDLILTQHMEKAALKGKWRERNRQRKASYRRHATKYTNEQAEQLAKAQEVVKSIEAKKTRAKVKREKLDQKRKPKQVMKDKLFREKAKDPKLAKAEERLKIAEQFKDKAEKKKRTRKRSRRH